MVVNIGNSWDKFFAEETKNDYYLKLKEFLIQEYKCKRIYPKMENIFAIFKEVPIENIKIVILGQDPYHQAGQSHGVSFSVMPGVRKPPSLINIFKELKEDIGCSIPKTGYLLPWVKQGVFLMNTCLTVEEGKAKSHSGKGWERFTDEVIRFIDQDPAPKVFFLWGKDARNKKKLIKNSNHLILEAVHPSPLSVNKGFFNSGHFSKANNFLKEKGRGRINWCDL